MVCPTERLERDQDGLNWGTGKGKGDTGLTERKLGCGTCNYITVFHHRVCVVNICTCSAPGAVFLTTVPGTPLAV